MSAYPKLAPSIHSAAVLEFSWFGNSRVTITEITIEEILRKLSKRRRLDAVGRKYSLEVSSVSMLEILMIKVG